MTEDGTRLFHLPGIQGQDMRLDRNLLKDRKPLCGRLETSPTYPSSSIKHPPRIRPNPAGGMGARANKHTRGSYL